MAILEEPIKEVVPLKNYIGGEWVESHGELMDVVNPATGRAIGKVPASTSDELKQAVDSARQASDGVCL